MYVATMYSKAEKIWWVKRHYGGSSYREVCEEFEQCFPDRPKPSHTTVMRTVSRFEDTGNVVYPRTGSHPIREVPASDYAVVAAVEANPYASCRSIAAEVGRSHSQVHRRLRKYGYKSYKTHTAQELRDGDAERRYTYAMSVADKLEDNPNFLKNVLFTDEKTFSLHHAPNRQNQRQWAQKNPRSVYSSQSQYPHKINVWAGILNQNILGPILIDGSLNGGKYLDLLQGAISDHLLALGSEDELWYQHDGCPAHNDVLAIEWLHNTFSGNVIGTHEALAWPARSPDLSPNDFWLWGHITTKIYDRMEPFSNVDDLWTAVQTCCNTVTHGQLANVQREIAERVTHCILSEGKLFEHLL